MLPKAILLLVLHSLCENAHSEDTDTFSKPVDLLTIKHLMIKDYNGPLQEETLKLFENIETLHLKNSNFTPVHHDYHHAVKNVRKIIVKNIHAELVDKDISTCCKKLTEVEVVHSGVDRIPFHKYGAWPLEKLTLEDETIPKLEKNCMKDTKLKSLRLVNCHVETVEEGAFNNLDNLENLDLEQNQIKTISRETLEPLKNLKKLNLGSNHLEKLTTDMIPSLPNLVHLNIAYNPIKEFNLEGIKSVAPNLALVDVTGIKIDTSKAGGVALTKSRID